MFFFSAGHDSPAKFVGSDHWELGRQKGAATRTADAHALAPARRQVHKQRFAICMYRPARLGCLLLFFFGFAEFFLDVTEELNCIVDRNGTLITAGIHVRARFSFFYSIIHGVCMDRVP